MNNVAVLELRNIARTYHQPARSLEVLKNVNLTLHEGELVALVGPSGSGKSTLLQIAGLLDAPQMGDILIAGYDVTAAEDALRTHLRNRHIGFIYQSHHLLPELTARENVMIPQSIAGVSRVSAGLRADALLERLGLTQRLHHVPAELSGGEQQRVAIARALANRPSIILADEPTGNLDPATSDVVRELLLEVAREERIAALIATHNLSFAERMSRMVTLKDGVLVPTRGRPQ